MGNLSYRIYRAFLNGMVIAPIVAVAVYLGAGAVYAINPSLFALSADELAGLIAGLTPFIAVAKEYDKYVDSKIEEEDKKQ